MLQGEMERWERKAGVWHERPFLGTCSALTLPCEGPTLIRGARNGVILSSLNSVRMLAACHALRSGTLVHPGRPFFRNYCDITRTGGFISLARADPRQGMVVYMRIL